MSNDMTLPILRVSASEVPERVLVVGDPARADRVAALLTEAKEVSRNREYVLWRGLHNGEEIGVVSHGVGSAGAGVCFEELCRAGARRILRAGTSGGLQPHVTDGHLVIAHAAVRDDGLTERLVPAAFPAIASVESVVALRAAAHSREAQYVEGIVLSSDVFYPHEVLGSNLKLWQRAGVIAVEMECSALFVTCSLHGVQAGAILTVDGNPLVAQDDSMAGYDPHRPVVDQAVQTMLEIALDVVALPV
jgi:uridine phosphorylase